MGPTIKGSDSLCPKCLRAVRQGSESCPKCGLVFALWEKGIARIPGMTADDDYEDPRASVLWRRVQEDPEDEANHEAFLTYCSESLRLDLAAARYQALLFQHPESSLGKTFRERIILLAQFNRPNTTKPRYNLPRFTGLKITLALGAIFMLLALMMARSLLAL
ncbi:MAG: hypothetical protein ACQET7_15430 [Thermodesulfobacteriota bacterium]